MLTPPRIKGPSELNGGKGWSFIHLLAKLKVTAPLRLTQFNSLQLEKQEAKANHSPLRASVDRLVID